MPLKHIIIVFVLVGFAAVLKPEWTMFFIWVGGMALLWIITGQWVPPSPNRKTEESGRFTPEAEQIKPMEASMEAEDLEDLERLDGAPRKTDERSPKHD